MFLSTLSHVHYICLSTSATPFSGLILNHSFNAEGLSVHIPFAPKRLTASQPFVVFTPPPGIPKTITGTPRRFIALANPGHIIQLNLGIMSALSRIFTRRSNPKHQARKDVAIFLAVKKKGISG